MTDLVRCMLFTLSSLLEKCKHRDFFGGIHFCTNHVPKRLCHLLILGNELVLILNYHDLAYVK